MINLLPDSAKRSLRATYYARLATVGITILAFVVFAGAAALLPSYLLARADAMSAEVYLADSSHTAAASQRAADTETLNQLSEEVSLMKSYPRAPFVAQAFSALTQDVPSGVSLSAITLMPNDPAVSVSISGVAGTRDELLAFANALQGDSSFSGVSVPLSELAGEANIPFSFSFSFTPSPL